MSLSVHFDRDLSLAHIDNGHIWLSAADAQGELLSVALPLADWSYLSSRPGSAIDTTHPHEYALTQLESFVQSLDLDDVPTSRLINVAMTDRI
jgi:hypothetical protein